MSERQPSRLAVVVPDLGVGGLQVLAVQIALALDRGEWLPAFYTFDGLGPLREPLAAAGVPCTHLPRRPGVDAGHAVVLARALRQDRADLVHCHNVTALFHGARAARRAGRLPVLFTEHDRELPAPLRHRLLHRWLARRTDATVAVSEGLRRALIATEGFPAARTSVIVNGVPDPRAAYAGDRAAARAELAWDAAPVVLAVGSLTAVKDHAGLVEAFARVRAAAPAARLVIAGEGPLRDGLTARAGALPSGAVTLLGERRDVPRLLAACDVFVLSSRSEGLSLSLVEAHGAGRPCVATDVGGNGEVLVAGETGLLVPPGDPAALAAALLALLEAPDRRAALGAAASTAPPSTLAKLSRRFTRPSRIALISVPSNATPLSQVSRM